MSWRTVISSSLRPGLPRVKWEVVGAFCVIMRYQDQTDLSFERFGVCCSLVENSIRISFTQLGFERDTRCLKHPWLLESTERQSVANT